MEGAIAIPASFGHPSARLLRGAPDERLVVGVREGNEAAFEAIYDRYHRGILAFSRHMLGSREEAEDAVQQIFVSAYRDLLESERPIQLRAWLYTIARNRCLSTLRARRERVALDDVAPETEGLATQVQRREDLRNVLSDLRRLPEQQRAALLLSELDAHTHDEIAVILGVRREKVKALVFQAREALAGQRDARAIPCLEVRRQLAGARGAARRRAPLRRHLSDCKGCQAFDKEVRHQRTALARGWAWRLGSDSSGPFERSSQPGPTGSPRLGPEMLPAHPLRAPAVAATV